MHWLCIGVVSISTMLAWGWEIRQVNADSRLPDSTLSEPNVAAATNSTRSATTIIAVGDVMLSRDVEQKMIRKNDWKYPFLETAELTSRGDIVFGNLESPLISGPAVPTGSMSFRADPKAVEGLAFAGFTVLSLANNHMNNRGADGIASTISALEQAGIAHAGAGLAGAESRQPAIIEKNGISFGFLAYTYNKGPSAAATTAHMDEQNLIADLDALRGKADVMVVSMHAGNEYRDQPSQQQIDFAHTAIDHGASLVIGHHPHVVQPIEQYNDGYILYSLGNFVFDQMWSRATREGAVATITFTGTAIAPPVLTPVLIYDFSQPRILTGPEADAVIERMPSFTK